MTYYIYTGISGLINYELIFYNNIHFYYPKRVRRIYAYISINEKHGNLKAIIRNGENYLHLELYNGTVRTHLSYGNLEQVIKTLKQHLNNYEYRQRNKRSY